MLPLLPLCSLAHAASPWTSPLNSTCDFLDDCFHTTAKCVFWILIRNAHFVVYTWSTCVFWITHYTHEWPKMWFFSRGGEEAWLCLGCLPIKHDVCCLRFLCMCSARYYRWKLLEGHIAAPKNTILRSSHSYTDIVAWFARIFVPWFEMRISNYVLRRDLAWIYVIQSRGNIFLWRRFFSK